MAAVQFITAADAENRQTQKAWDARVSAGLADCYKNFPELVPSQETADMIILWCEKFLGYSCVPNAVILKSAKDQNRQAWKEDFGPLSLDVQKQRAEITARILILVANGGAMAEAEMAAYRRKLSSFTRDALLNREQMIINAQRLTGICNKAGGGKAGVDALKAERAEMRGDNEPRLIVLLPSEYTAKVLKQLANTNLEAFKKLQRDYGKQVDDRLAGRS